MEPADFLEPKGKINPKWLAGVEDVNAFIQDVINEAESLTTNNLAQGYWVYYKLFFKITADMNSRPTSESVMGDSQSYSVEQIKFFEKQAEAYLEAYNNLLSPITETVNKFRGTRSFRVYPSF